MKRPIVPFFIPGRGCPHQCIFCDQKRISGSDDAFPDADRIRTDIERYRVTAGGPVDVAFYGGTFTALSPSTREELLAPLQPLLAEGTVTAVRVSTRPDAIDGEIVSSLRRMGVTTVELGVQSLDDGVLHRAGRGYDSGTVERAAALLRDGGIRTGIQLMMGLPGDTPAGCRTTLRKALDLEPALLRIYPTLVIAGTALADLWRRGEYRPLTLDEAVDLGKILLLDAARRGVPVVRGGLQENSSLRSADVVLAGPHHPAFRQLAEGELYFDLLVQLVRGLTAGTRLLLACAPGKLSELVGQNRRNLRRLQEQRGLRVAAVRGDEGLAVDEIRIEAGGETRSGSILTDLDYSEEVSVRG